MPLHGLVEGGDAFQAAELRQLGNELAVILWLQRVLVFQLGDQQLQERILAQFLLAGGRTGRRAQGIGGGAGLDRGVGQNLVEAQTTCCTGNAHVTRPLSPQPRVRTFCIMVSAVFIISALVWNERLAEIMSAISSTTLTFG